MDRKLVGWRAREWRRMLDEGVYRNQSELTRGEGVSTAAVSIALRNVLSIKTNLMDDSDTAL